MVRQRSNTAAQCAWSLLRLALQRIRLLKRQLTMELKLATKSLRRLNHSCSTFSESEIHIKGSRRGEAACVSTNMSSVDHVDSRCRRHCDGDRESVADEVVENKNVFENQCEDLDDGGIDVRAEKFIAKFYEELKLQRQISWGRYDEITTKN